MIIRTLATGAAILLTSTLASAQDVRMFVPEGQEPIVARFRMAPAIQAGDYVFISGVVGYIVPGEERTEEAYEAAIRDTFERVETVLNAAGTGWSDVVEMTSFHVDMREHQEIFVRVREEFVTAEPYPAWTAIGVEQLWQDPLFLEIRVVAYVGED